MFVNYYDYAALIPSQLQRTLNGLDVRGRALNNISRGYRIVNNKQRASGLVALPASSSTQNQTKEGRKC